MNKKKLMRGLALCLTLCMCIGGMFAFFTDSDAEQNTFTVGSVDIDLIESQYHRTNGGKGNATGLTEPIIGGYLWAADVDLQGTPENTPNYVTSGEVIGGTYFSDEQILADAETYKAEGGYFETESAIMVPGDNVRKNPYVQNVGENDAYIRVRALIPVSLFEVIDNGLSMWTTTALEEGEIFSHAVDAYVAAGNSAEAFVESGAAADFIVVRDGIEYYEFDFTYTDAVKPGELTFWNCWGNIAIDKWATEAELANVESFDVIFEADAIQSEGIATAAEAFEIFDSHYAAN